ncbi:MAG: alpha/beta hydrolase [Candidatus Colwellbacteria bacterium]|nr:alpha/beta hydrolase [Candidatus Colwellbacteria bacterium]
MTPLEEKQIVLNKLLINYYVLENPKAETSFVFLHGWRSEAKVWLPIINSLVSEKIKIYALDLPGFGKSEMPPKTFTLADYAETIAQFIETLKLKNACLVGHSFGGRVAIKLAATRPDLIQKLFLANSAGIRRLSVKRGFSRAGAKIVKPIFKLPPLQPLREKIYRRIGAEDYLVAGKMKETFLKTINEDLTPFLPEIKQKTVIIWGDKDQETPFKDGELMAKEIPHAKLEIIKGAGHYSFIDKPDRFIQVLKEFLNEPA